MNLSLQLVLVLIKLIYRFFEWTRVAVITRVLLLLYMVHRALHHVIAQLARGAPRGQVVIGHAQSALRNSRPYIVQALLVGIKLFHLILQVL